jgi:hypothetical protein
MLNPPKPNVESLTHGATREPLKFRDLVRLALMPRCDYRVTSQR